MQFFGRSFYNTCVVRQKADFVFTVSERIATWYRRLYKLDYIYPIYNSPALSNAVENINTFGIKDAKESMLALQSIQKIDEMFKDKEIEVIKNDQEVLIFKFKRID